MKARVRTAIAAGLLACLLAGAGGIQATATEIPVAEGESIQAAVDHASAGDVIVVSGLHREQVEIDRAVRLQGDNATLRATGGGTVIKIVASEVAVTDLAIQGHGTAHIGVEIIGRDNATANVTLSNVTIAGCQWYGVWARRLTVSPTITNATITRCDTGVKLDVNATEAAITNNTIYNNTYGVVATMDVTDASIHHNVFNNTHNARDTTPPDSNNQWDNGSVGNYWDDYRGNDEDGDGIGDTPYPIAGGSHQDRYPLVKRPTNNTYPPGNGNGNGNETSTDTDKGIPGFGILPFLAAVVFLASIWKTRGKKGK